MFIKLRKFSSFLPLPGFDSGIRFSFQKLLRLGVIGLGFDFSTKKVPGAGWRGLALDLITVVAVFGTALFWGRRVCLPVSLALLLGTGTAIC